MSDQIVKYFITQYNVTKGKVSEVEVMAENFDQAKFVVSQLYDGPTTIIERRYTLIEEINHRIE